MSEFNLADRVKQLRYATIAVSVTVTVLSIIWIYRTFSFVPQTYRISAGSEFGVYATIADQLSTVLQKQTGDRYSILSSQGSIQNADRLESGECDFALIQNDTPPNPAIRSVAVLYSEPLHLLVRRDSGIRSLQDLAGKRVNLGPESGGTFAVASTLMEFVLSKDDADVRRNNLDISESIAALVSGELDAGFFVTGLRAPSLLKALQDENLLLLPLVMDAAGGQQEAYELIDGFRTVYPYVQRSSIPMKSYGRFPSQALPTLGISAVLACRSDLSADIVNAATQIILENRAGLAKDFPPMAGFTEQSAIINLQFPLHPGADDYYRRREPSFLAEHAESMGFVLTVALLLGSGLKGIASWRKQLTKDHIDTYFQRLSLIGVDVAGAESPEELRKHSDRITDLENEASQDLVDEKLSPNDAYLILQQMSSSMKAKIQLRVDEIGE